MKENKIKVDKIFLSNLLKKVKSNKKYKSLSSDIVIKEIKNYLKSNPKVTSIDRESIKQIRSMLHKKYSSFQTKGKRKRNLYLEELEKHVNSDNKDILEITKKLLSIVVSTKERVNDYSFLYESIFKHTGFPETIVDLGCGMNPLSYPFMDLKKVKYFCYDIDEQDINFLNKYFEVMKKRGFFGHAEILDMTDTDNVKNLPKSNIAFLFKTLDVIDIKNHKASEALIKQLINITDFIVVSFATKTITMKQMNKPRRVWFERMLERLKINFEIIKLENEIFYLLSV
ncbi:hypothetical protein GOV14_03280 [Candidatus Pacearchaeota archaeon]|nr:hypothetical protein [Candidatus Pacearchaeota archaeon]